MIQLNFIYSISNTINSKKYIGKTTMGKRRWWLHKANLRNNRSLPNKHIQYAWNKHGEDRFLFQIIEYCSEENLSDRERYWILHCKSNDRRYGYNKTNGGEGCKHSAETKALMSIAQRKIKRIGSSHPNWGKKASNETKAKQSKAKQKAVKRISLDRAKTKQYDSALDAALEVSKSKWGSSHIAKAIKGKTKTAYGYYWEYI